MKLLYPIACLLAVVFQYNSFAQQVDLQVVSITSKATLIEKNEITDLILTVCQNGPENLPRDAARLWVAIDPALIKFVAPCIVSDDCGNMWTVQTKNIGEHTSQIQLRNLGADLDMGSTCKIYIPIEASAQGTATITINGTVFANGVSDLAGTNQTAAASLAIVSSGVASARTGADLAEKTGILVYSNPVGPGDKLLMQSKDGSVSGVSIYDIGGKQVYSAVNPGKQISTDMLTTGIYILRLIHSDGSTSTHRVVKQ